MSSTPSSADVPPRRRARGRAGLTAQFLLAVGEEVVGESLTPAALARAAVKVLPVDGAGMSAMVRELRMPLGATDDAAARAEELQTSLGDGPCLHAAEMHESVAMDLAELERRWPLYTEELIAQTDYRAVVSVPLRAPGRTVFAALDLYAKSPQLDDTLDLTEIDELLAAPAAALLTTCLEQVHGGVDIPEALPSWYQTAAGRRHNVWVAIGMIMAARPNQRDALSLMRAHAYSQERSLDELAADMVDGRVAPTDVAD